MPSTPPQSGLANPDLLMGIPLPWRSLVETWEWVANSAWAFLPLVLLLWIPLFTRQKPRRHLGVWAVALTLAWSIWLAPVGQWAWSAYVTHAEGVVCTYIPNTKGAYPLSFALACLVGPLHAWWIHRSHRPFNPNLMAWIFALVPTAVVGAGLAHIVQAWVSLALAFTGHA